MGAGVRASVALHRGAQPSPLSADTLPFFPESVRNTFSRPATLIDSLPSPLHALFLSRCPLKSLKHRVLISWPAL